MRSDRLRVFVSSKMAELAAERAAIKDVLDDLNVDAWVFEQDAGARPETIEESYREQLEASDLYIGVFWKGYGDYTIDEFELARATETDCLIYQKQGAEAEGRDQRLQAFLGKIGKVETGLTVQFFDSPDELREMVKRDTARWQTRIVRKYREGGRRGATGLPADPNLVILRNKVKQFWIEGVLGRAIAETGGLMKLSREYRPEAVQRPAKDELPVSGVEVAAFDPEARLTEIFEQVGGSLVILGAPGAGKTTTALELARDLITGAERDDSRAVPVVLNLSAWSGEFGSLIDWIVHELSRKYHVPEWIGRSWVEQDRLVLLLDGLDEVAAAQRAGCCDAVNGFVEKHGAEGLVVTSRIDEYEALPVRLDLAGAIFLEPLAAAQVDAHLEEAGETLAGLRAALERDETLKGLARTPLMLSVMSLAYRDRPAEELEPDEGESAEARSASLFDAYVDRAFQDRDPPGRYSREAVTSWLSWLARHMVERSRTVFMIEDLQPSWLERRAQLGAYLLGLSTLLGFVFGGLCILYRLNPSMRPPMRPPMTPSTLDLEESVVWVMACSLFFLGIGLTDGLRVKGRAAAEAEVAGDRRDDLRRIAANVVIFGLLWTPIALAMKNLLGPYERDRFVFQVIVPAAALVMGFAALGARRSVSRRIETAESLALERAFALRGARWGLLAGAPFAVLTFWAIRADTGMDGSPTPWVGVFWCLMGAAVGAVLAGFRPRLVRGKTVPNQGMVLTLETSLRAAATALPLTALALLTGVALDDFYRQPRLLLIWSTVALPFFAVCIAAWFGGLDLAKHHLLRGVIGATRQGPFDFRRLLSEAGRRNLMQRVGGGYMFAHRPLLDRFAALDLPPPLAAEVRDAEAGRSRFVPAAFAATLVLLLGAILPWVVPEAAVRPVLIVEAVVLGLAFQWLLIRSAVASALRTGRKSPE